MYFVLMAKILAIGQIVVIFPTLYMFYLYKNTLLQRTISPK